MLAIAIADDDLLRVGDGPFDADLLVEWVDAILRLRVVRRRALVHHVGAFRREALEGKSRIFYISC